MEKSFEQWMEDIDAIVQRVSGVSVHDLPDANFRDFYDAETPPDEVAKEVLVDAGYTYDPALDLMPPALKKNLPKLYSTEEQGLEAKALVKYFLPVGGWTWYASEFDGEDRFFGFVIGQFAELGYFSLSELQSITSVRSMPIQIERDLHFKPTSLRELKEYYEKHGRAR